MQRTIVTCGIIAGAFIVLVVVGVMLGGMYMSRPLPAITIPPPWPLPRDNGFDDCVRAASMVKDDDKLDGLDAAKQPREAEALVKLNGPALDLVRKALPKDYMTPRIKQWDEDFPYLHGFRNIAKLFILEGQLKASKGDIDGAVECFLDARRFGALVPNGGFLIHRAVAKSISERGYAGLETICPKLDASQCRHVLRELGEADLREPSVLQTLEWEKTLGLLFIKDLQEGKLKDETGKPIGGPFPPMADRMLGRGRSSLEDYESYMNALQHESSKPLYRRKLPPEPKTLGSAIATPSSDVLGRTSLVSTRERLLKLMLALRAYSLKHGAYPESLAGLKSYGIDTVDEFSGKPLVYKRTAGGYLLYSIGPDGKDDGGKPLDSDDRGDIVAGRMFPPKIARRSK